MTLIGFDVGPWNRYPGEVLREFSFEGWQTQTADDPILSIEGIITLPTIETAQYQYPNVVYGLINPISIPAVIAIQSGEIYFNLLTILDSFKWQNITVYASLALPIRQAQINIFGTSTPETFSTIDASLLDHNDVERNVFRGILTTLKPNIQPANKTVKCVGYDHGYYLSRQPLPNGNVFSATGWDPASIVRYLCGGTADWNTTTGIYPYHVSHSGSNPTNDYVFPAKTSKLAAIQSIASLVNNVVLIKPVLVESKVVPGLYFVPLELVDDPAVGLDLPDPETFTYPDPFVIGNIDVLELDETKYNKVSVYSFANDGSVFVDRAYDPGVETGDVLAIEYVEETTLYDEISIVGKADIILGDLNREVKTYRASLLKRVDLELMQKIKFVGFEGISDSWMRIIDIKYYSSAADVRVEIECILDFDLSDISKITRVSSPTNYTNTKNIAQAVVNEQPKNQVGTVLSVDADTCTVQNERGEIVTVRYIN